MKRSLIILCAALAIIFLLVEKEAYSYSFPINSNQMNLNHNFAYTWGMSEPLETNSIITEASLTLSNINNWQIEPDYLYVHLLDSAPAGVSSDNDVQGEGDYFGSMGLLLFTYTDDNESSYTNGRGKIKWENPAEDFIYHFDLSALATLNAYLKDGILGFGFGFDPDCHYNFDGISFHLLTELVPDPPIIDPDPPIIAPDPPITDPDPPASVPEPGTLILLGAGLTGLAFFRRYNLKK